MVHAALLHLMLEAANARPRFTISLKRSTQKSFSYPQAAGRLPHLLTQSGHKPRYRVRPAMQFPAPKSDIVHAGGVTPAGSPWSGGNSPQAKHNCGAPPGWTEPVPRQKGEPEGTV